MTYRFKIALRLKKPLAGRAVVVKARLAIVLLQTILFDKNLIARPTIPVAFFVVVFQVTDVVKMIVAILAIWVARTLNPVFFQPCPGCEVLRAIVTDIVTRGICVMLMESWPRSKYAVASFAVGHDEKGKSHEQ